jgi:hypothetical protein
MLSSLNRLFNNELCGNEANSPMRNEERSLMVHQRGLWAIPKTKPKKHLKTNMKVMSKKVNKKIFK